MSDEVQNRSAGLRDDPEFRLAFAANEREVRMRTGKLACVLVVALMPVGISLDIIVLGLDSHFIGRFLLIRLLCSLLTAGVWLMHYLEFGARYYRVLQQLIVLIPAAGINLMIFMMRSGGDGTPTSEIEAEFAKFATYYAGLNLIIVAISAVGHWVYWDSLVSVALVVTMYILAHGIRGQAGKVDHVIFFNNLYFLGLTGIIVVAGNRVFNQLAFREFESRYELERSRKEIEATNDKLVELDRVKNRFFANISHELRTPLTLLLAPLESLLHNRDRRLDSQTREWLNTMHGNALRLLRLINDLLDLVRLQSGKMEVLLEPVSMSEFVGGLMSSLKKLAEDRHLNLRSRVTDEVGTVLVDRDKVEKILLNLLFNAIKFTPASGRVELDVAREGDRLMLRVSDTGMGIPPEKQPFVFQRLWQGDVSAQRKFQGAGIGLALVKELTEIQKGNVEFESELGLGSKFTVWLPFLKPGTGKVLELPQRAEPDKEPSPTEAGPSDSWLAGLYRRAEFQPTFGTLQDTLRPVDTAPRTNQPRVLIADDEPDMLRFLQCQLADTYQVIEAVDGVEAVEKSAQFLPEAILCDMMMPEKDGLEVCRELRQRKSTQAIPILLITARADEETKLAALEAGASDFLTKPFSTTELRVRLRNLVEGAQLQRQISRQNRVLEATVTQLKETETQLVGAEKMASLGRLSAGIMHEVSNPLNFMKTGLYLLRNKVTSVPEADRQDVFEMLKDIDDGLVRVQSIVGDLRRFAHPDPSLREQVKADEVVGVALRFLSHELKSGVKIVKEIDPEHTVYANRNQLVHVLINLVQNAAHAVRNKPNRADEPCVWIESSAVNGLDRLIVRDNGTGIRSEHLDKVFEPFFTTKAVGEGTGLGLSICYRIIEQHQGRIAVDSKLGEYTRFTIELPRREDSRRAAP